MTKIEIENELQAMEFVQAMKHRLHQTSNCETGREAAKELLEQAEGTVAYRSLWAEEEYEQ
jgi:hypothetical protein